MWHWQKYHDYLETENIKITYYIERDKDSR